MGLVVRWKSETPNANQVIYHALNVVLFRFESISWSDGILLGKRVSSMIQEVQVLREDVQLFNNLQKQPALKVAVFDCQNTDTGCMNLFGKPQKSDETIIQSSDLVPHLRRSKLDIFAFELMSILPLAHIRLKLQYHTKCRLDTRER